MFLFGRGCRNRTHADGFGDHRTTIIRTPRNEKFENSIVSNLRKLLSFFMDSLFFAESTEFFQFKSLLYKLTFFRIVIYLSAIRSSTLQLNPRILRHIFLINKSFLNIEYQRHTWSPLSDLNRPPTVYKTVALPDELSGQIIFELAPRVREGVAP